MDVESRSTWIARFRRDQLVDIMEGRGPTPKSSDAWYSAKDFENGYLLGIWIGENRTSLHPLPQIVVAEQNVLEDLYAWSGTYLRSLGPLSSLMRIVTTEQFEMQLHPRYPDNLWEIVGGMVGIVTAEILMRAQISIATVVSESLPSTALSYAMFRSAALGYSAVVMDDIVHNYSVLWRMLGPQKIGDPIRKLPHIATCLLGIDGSDGAAQSLFARAQTWMNDLRSGVALVDVARQAIPYDDDGSRHHYVDRLADMTAEERVRMFDVVARRIVQEGVVGESDDSAFALALGAFVCRPGLGQQALLIDDYRRDVPEAMLWLGALQAFAPASDVLEIGGGFGWRVARDIFRTEGFWDAPRVDAAFSEIGGDKKRIAGAYRGLFERGRVDVELYPMVVAGFEIVHGKAGERVEGAGRSEREFERGDEILLGRLWHLEKQLNEAASSSREVRQRFASRIERLARGRPRRRRY